MRSQTVSLILVPSLLALALACGGSPATFEQAGLDRAPALAVPASVAAQTAAPVDRKAEAATYIGYYRTIQLTPEQEAVKNEALSAIPAPCCSENSIATCCCPCNLAKAAWGLSAYLITEKGYGVAELRQAVRDWLKASNPGGSRGDACSTGGCARSFEHDGCGGMVEGVVL